MATVEEFFPLDHPAVRGHFPGNPIIPGAVLLSTALRAIETRLALSPSRGKSVSAKFLHPVRPGDRVRVEFSESASGAIKFACAVGEIAVLTGVMTCQAISTQA